MNSALWSVAPVLLLLSFSVAGQDDAPHLDARWDTLEVGVDIGLYGLTFPTADEGWAVGWGPPGVQAASILRTSDGGRSWTCLFTSPNDLLFELAVSPSGVLVAVGQRGITDEGLIVTSLDGGATWLETTVPSSFGLYDVEFAGLVGFACGYDGAMLRTDDGGVSWNLLPTGTASVFRALSVVDADRVFALGGSAFQGRAIWATRDGGRNWVRLAVFGGGTVLGDLHFHNSLEGIAIGWFQGLGSILATKDGGLTWVSVATSSDGLQAVAFRGLEGWTVGIGDLVHHTLDGGRTWESYPGPEGGPFLVSTSVMDGGMLAGAGGGRIHRLTLTKAPQPRKLR